MCLCASTSAIYHSPSRRRALKFTGASLAEFSPFCGVYWVFFASGDMLCRSVPWQGLGVKGNVRSTGGCTRHEDGREIHCTGSLVYA